MILLFACGISCGSEALIKEERPMDGFTRLSLSGYGNVYVIQGNEEKLIVEAQPQTLEYIETAVSRGKLTLGFKDRRHSNRNLGPINYYVTMITIESLGVSGSGDIEAGKIKTGQFGLHISGSGNINIDELDADEIKVSVSGSGDCAVSGKLKYQDIHISGSGNYNAKDLKCDDATVSISGSGDVKIWVMDDLDVHISGSGKVGYYGRPAVNSHSSGSGSTTHLGDR